MTMWAMRGSSGEGGGSMVSDVDLELTIFVGRAASLSSQSRGGWLADFGYPG